MSLMFVNFDKSINSKSEAYKDCILGENPKYLRSMPQGVNPKKFLLFCKDLYKNISYIKNNKVDNLRIPKIIHQIWLGPNKFPDDYNYFINSFKKKHPDWEYIFWNEDKIKKIFKQGFLNQYLFNLAYKREKYAKASDILRYEILYKFGGLYVDLDCKCVKPFDLLHQKFDFYAGLENIYNGLVVGNAIIGSKARHPIIKQTLRNIRKYFFKKIDMKYWKGFSDYQEKDEIDYAKTLITTGPIVFTKSIWQKANKLDNLDIIFPPTYFYPCAEYKSYPIKKETLASHFFRGLWKKKMLRKEKNL
ncbi:hypothetical protein GF385_00410 [Candidatus Dependentiae bacterium]|nr:hypothetical protein [Candidatus Dependentiae bacterium]